MRRRALCAGAVAMALVAVIGGLAGAERLFRRATAPDAILADPVRLQAARPDRGAEVRRISPERWSAICRKFYPCRAMPDVSHLLHHLLNWGPDALFAGGIEALPGPTMLEILTDDRADPHYAPRSPLLYRGEDGRPRLARSGEPGSESHPHQVLAAFAELGLPSSRLIRSGRDSATIAELVDAARADFHLQGEIEWTVVALACYAPTPDTWTNRWGRSFNFDMVAEMLLARPYGEGACCGTHLLSALTVMLRVDAEHRLVSDAMRDRIRRHLAGAIERLRAHQRTSGCWTPDWPLPLAEPDYEAHDEAIFGESRMVQATGHHLEWLDSAPADLAIDAGAHRRALDWCITALERTPDIGGDRLCPYSHCFRMVRRHAAPAESVGEGGIQR